MTASKTVSLVISVWNRKDDLRENLAAIRAQSVTPDQVVVVDNDHGKIMKTMSIKIHMQILLLIIIMRAIIQIHPPFGPNKRQREINGN